MDIFSSICLSRSVCSFSISVNLAVAAAWLATASFSALLRAITPQIMTVMPSIRLITKITTEIVVIFFLAGTLIVFFVEIFFHKFLYSLFS